MRLPLRFAQVIYVLCALMLVSMIAADAAASTQAASKETVLHSFSLNARGGGPFGLISDSSGRLFGTGQTGGQYNNGVVYELASNSQGNWVQTVLYSFTGGADGAAPYSPILGPDGAIYGIAGLGGSGACNSGCGTAYKLTQNSGVWVETTLYSFQASDGYATGALVVDDVGNLYGAVSNYTGGSFSVFKLTPTGGTWTESILYSFTSPEYGASIPGLVLDAAGNLYGTLTEGTTATQGLVFELSLSGSSWTEKDLYSFTGGTSGSIPTGPLLLQNGTFYGTTLDGGQVQCYRSNSGCGIVFSLTPGSNGLWTEKVVYAFQGTDEDGPIFPQLTDFDGSGNLYGLTVQGGAGSCPYCGSVFQLNPANGVWKETDLWDFDGGSDGDYPTAVALAPSGEIYGVAAGPGIGEQPQPRIFELTSQSSPSDKSSLTVLYTFPFTDGDDPLNGLVADAAGNLYGTTTFGGQSNIGSIFKMTRANGGWKETLLYSFGPVSYSPYYSAEPSGLVFDTKGNLYGTTQSDGAGHLGTAFELSQDADGSWKKTTLYTFTNNGGVYRPIGGVVFDKAGNIYGAALWGGTIGYGGVFELTPGANGSWTETVIYSFGGYPTDGADPAAGLAIDVAGNLYGTTQRGGNGHCQDNVNPRGCGTVFELSYSASTGWKETMLHSFLGSRGADGAAPSSVLILDQAGNIYGTTESGGAFADKCSGYGVPAGCGTVFELSPSASGWTKTTLYQFAGGKKDGLQPEAGLTSDDLGNLYGTTTGGGAYGYGSAFKLTPAAGGAWQESLVHSFGNGSDGRFPNTSLLPGAGGAFYGATPAGGVLGGPSNNGQGTVYEIVP